jgi:hypothetical protein
MSKVSRKKVVAAKIESVYGTDPVPTGSEAMLVKNLSITPIEPELVSRDLLRPYFGNSENLLAQKYSKIDFEVEYQASGTVGLAPAYDALLRACAFTKSTTTVSCTIAVLSGTATVTKSTHGYLVGDIVTIAGCTDSALNGAQTILTVANANTFTYATLASDDVSADGTPVINSAIVYSPVSSSLESVTIYFNIDGLLHKITGAMGSVEASLAVKQIPVFKFTFTGLYNAPSDTSAVVPVYTGFKIPKIVNTANTTAYSLLSYSGLLSEMNLNMANDVQYITLVGSESVKIIDRKPAGNMVIEAPTIASKDFFTAVADSTTGALTITHGSANGYKVKMDAPSILLGAPQYQELSGIEMLSLSYTAQPTSAGNDEVTLTFK